MNIPSRIFPGPSDVVIRSEQHVTFNQAGGFRMKWANFSQKVNQIGLCRVPTNPRKRHSMTFPRLSKTSWLFSMTIHHFWQEIHYWTTSETIISATKFWMQVRAKFMIFHDLFVTWDSRRFSRETHDRTIREIPYLRIYFERHLG